MSEEAEEVEEPDVELISGYRTLSDWQLSRVRNALRAYHRYERDPKIAITPGWMCARRLPTIPASISAPVPRTARSACGSLWKGSKASRRTRGGSIPVPKTEALEGIIGFLTHEDLKLLSEDELAEYMPAYQAPLRLIEYFVQDCDMAMSFDVTRLQGVLHAIRPDRDGYSVRTITLQRGMSEGMLQTVETREHYLTEPRQQAMAVSGGPEYEPVSSSVQYGGWAVITPEDSLILFLKHSANGRNSVISVLMSWSRR